MKMLKNIYYELRRIRDYLYIISTELEEYIRWKKLEKEYENEKESDWFRFLFFLASFF